MSITFNLYRNFDGSLDGRYKQGDKPEASWQLPTANYVNTGMPMNLVFPRPEAASWSYAKNAYTGVKWNIPIGVQGGAWPFHYEIINDGGAAGVSVGNFLLGVIDGPTGKTTYSVPDDYGVLSWDSPVAGSYTITVRVTDQTGATLDVVVSLTVGTSGWLFVDPVGGNDSTGDGSIGNPFASLVPLHNDSSATATYANHRVYLRDGVTPLGYMTTASNLYSLQSAAVPCQYIGYPNESAVLEWDGGWFLVGTGVTDFLVKDLECRYKNTYAPSGTNTYMFRVGGCDRASFIGNNFTNYAGSPTNTGAGNSSIIFLAGVNKNNFLASRNEQSGVTGTFVTAFQIYDSLVEHHYTHDATIATLDGSTRSLIMLKDEAYTVTVRNVDISENNTWSTDNYGGVGVYGQDGTDVVEICYCSIINPNDPSVKRAGAIYNWGLNPYTDLIDNIYVYRNSLSIGIKWEGANHLNMPDGAEVHEKNIYSDGAEVVSTKVVNIDNLSGSTTLDASNKLTGAARTSYLGTHGAEVAQ